MCRVCGNLLICQNVSTFKFKYTWEISIQILSYYIQINLVRHNSSPTMEVADYSHPPNEKYVKLG